MYIRVCVCVCVCVCPQTQMSRSYFQSNRPHSSEISSVSMCQAEKRSFLSSCTLVKRAQLRLVTRADLHATSASVLLPNTTHTPILIHLTSNSREVSVQLSQEFWAKFCNKWNVICLFPLTWLKQINRLSLPSQSQVTLSKLLSSGCS